MERTPIGGHTALQSGDNRGMKLSDDISAGRGKPLTAEDAEAAKPKTHTKRGMKRGYFVRGQFVAEGSELDLELKSEFASSRTVAKEESTALQELGEQLLTLPAAVIAKLDLPEKLVDAVAEAKKITNFEGKRRQMQYIGKLMRRVEPEPIRAAVLAQREGSADDKIALKQSEKWRDRLIADDAALQEWVGEHPGTDIQQLRSLVRQARKDAAAALAAATSALAAGAATDAPAPLAKQSKATKEIFQLVRAALASHSPASDDQGEDN